MREAAEELRALTVSEIALVTRRSVRTVQNDVANGAPVVRRGSVGRNRGALLDLAAYRRWLEGPGRTIDLGAVARALFAVHTKPPAGSIHQLWKRLRITEAAALELLLENFREIARQVTGAPIADADLPAEMRALFAQLAECRRQQLQKPLREDFR